jgi:hypothetical protein
VNFTFHLSGGVEVSSTELPMQPTADFYLSTNREYEGLAAPRACYVKARLSDGHHDDHLLVRIDPPLIGQPFGLGSRDIDQLLVSPKWQEITLCPVVHWPAPVYVARILDESIAATKTIQRDQVEVIAWGLLFQTAENAWADFERS